MEVTKRAGGRQDEEIEKASKMTFLLCSHLHLQMIISSKVKNGIDVINETSLNLFVGQPEIKLLPMLYDNLVLRPSFLFMGINPSFNWSKINSLIKLHLKAHPDDEELLPCEQDQFNIKYARDINNNEKLKRFQRLAKNLYDYFKPFQVFAEKNNLKATEWDQVDLFLERDSDYKNILAFGARGIISEFGIRQLKITNNLIQLIKPINLVVANRLASTIFSIYFGKQLRKCKNENCWKLRLLSGDECRIFYSGQWYSRWPNQRAENRKDQETIKEICFPQKNAS